MDLTIVNFYTKKYLTNINLQESIYIYINNELISLTQVLLIYLPIQQNRPSTTEPPGVVYRL